MHSSKKGLSAFSHLLLWAVFATSFPYVQTCTFKVTSKETHAMCTREQLTRLPNTWPGQVKSLDASFNNLTSLQGVDNPSLRDLRRLDLSHNSITTVAGGALQALSQLEELDLSANGLLTFPHHAFRGLTRLTSLDLSNNAFSMWPSAAFDHTPKLTTLNFARNRLTELTNYSFVGLGELRQLDLSVNQLTHLGAAAFCGLGKLTELALEDNQLLLTSQAFPPGVFSPLTSLLVLRLHNNDHRKVGAYDMPALGSLASLRTLSIDTFIEAQFDHQFAGLTSLTTLTLSYSCQITRLRNNTFQAFKNSTLQRLYLEGCRGLMIVEKCVFCELPQLKVLVFAYNKPVAVGTLLGSLYGLQHQTMSLVRLSNTLRWYPTLFTAANTMYLRTMCIESLVLKNTYLAGIEYDAIDPDSLFCRCLKHVDLSGNAFQYVPVSVSFKLFLCGRNLRTFNMHNQRKFSRFSYRYESTRVPNEHVELTVAFPPYLSFINISRVSDDSGDIPFTIHITNGTSLVTADISYIGLTSCNITVKGLTSLKTLNISGNNCRATLNTDMFYYMTSIQHLGLADILLDQTYVMTHVTRLLRPLQLLKTLDLSNNELRCLPPDMLHAQSGLQELALAGNKFQSVPVALALQTNLSLLDLSGNMLTTLQPHERSLLNTLAQTHTVHLHLRGNPLSCACAELDFVRWLALTAVRLDGDIHTTDDDDDNGRDYPCIRQDGRMWSTGRVMADWEGHWRKCVGQKALIFAVIGIFVQLLGLLLTFVISRNWTYIRYAWRVLHHLPLPRRLTFRKDVVLGHADRELAIKVRDILKDRHDVRVLFPYEEVMPGDIWAEKTLQLVDDSWKILLLVTRNFLQDPHTGFLVHHAQCSISDTMPDRVLLLFLEQPAQLAHRPHQPTDGPQQPANVSLQRLLRVVPDRNVFHVHRDTVTQRHPVWDRLTDLILYH